MEHKLCDLVTDKRRYQSDSRRTAWTAAEDALLLRAIHALSEEKETVDWIQVSQSVPARTSASCQQRYTKVLCPGLKKGPWSPEEDAILLSLTLHGAVEKGEVDWTELCKHIQGRTPKQCRERWKNVLNPSVQRGRWDPSEDGQLFRLYATFGPSWSVISREMHGLRNENMVKNRWRRLGSTPQGQACQQHFMAQKWQVEQEEALGRDAAAAAAPTISPCLSRSPAPSATTTTTTTTTTTITVKRDSPRMVKRQHSLDEPPPTQAGSGLTFGEFVELVALQESLAATQQPQQHPQHNANVIAPPAALRRVDSFYEDNCSLFNQQQQHDDNDAA